MKIVSFKITAIVPAGMIGNLVETLTNEGGTLLSIEKETRSRPRNAGDPVVRRRSSGILRKGILEALTACGPLSPGLIAERANLPVSSLGNALRRLEARGEVRRIGEGRWEAT